jgi:VanZ family protein
LRQDELSDFLGATQKGIIVAMLKNRKRIFLGIINVVIFVVIMIAGLWPFNFSPDNKVKWLGDKNGVRFYGQGIIFSDPSTSVPFHPLFLNRSITIEILLQPDSETVPYISQILSLCDGKTYEGFFLAQWQSDLILQSNRIYPNKKWTHKKIELENMLEKERKRFISITSDDKETCIFIDGKLTGSHHDFSLLSSKDKTMSFDLLVLGNSATGKQYWIGNLFGLAIYNRVLTHEQIIRHFKWWADKKTLFPSGEEDLVALYVFNERSGQRAENLLDHHHFLIPTKFKMLQKTIFVPPWQDFRLNRSYIEDVVVNILGFIPLGFFLPAYLTLKKNRTAYRHLFLSVLLAGCISLTIELAQVYLPTRASQLTDVITNMAGAALGAALFYFCHQKKQPKYSNPPVFNS